MPLMPIGRNFLEVVAPVKQDTAAGRYLERREGDGGYMVIIQVDNFSESKNLVDKENISVVWESKYAEAQAIHLHPKQMGGAILSLDSMDPPSSWKWAGDNWEKYMNTETATSVKGVQIQSKNPQAMCKKWKAILGKNTSGNKITLDNTWIEFIYDEDGRGDGIYSFDIQVKDNNLVRRQSK